MRAGRRRFWVCACPCPVYKCNTPTAIMNDRKAVVSGPYCRVNDQCQGTSTGAMPPHCDFPTVRRGERLIAGCSNPAIASDDQDQSKAGAPWTKHQHIPKPTRPDEEPTDDNVIEVCRRSRRNEILVAPATERRSLPQVPDQIVFIIFLGHHVAHFARSLVAVCFSCFLRLSPERVVMPVLLDR